MFPAAPSLNCRIFIYDYRRSLPYDFHKLRLDDFFDMAFLRFLAQHSTCFLKCIMFELEFTNFVDGLIGSRRKKFMRITTLYFHAQLLWLIGTSLKMKLCLGVVFKL